MTKMKTKMLSLKRQSVPIFQILDQQNIKLQSRQIRTDLKAIFSLLTKRKLRQSERLGQNLTVVFLKPSEMKKINKNFRGKDKVTDILSFQTEPTELGELLICVPQIKKQAKEQGHSLRDELNFMLIHGLLHLLGYDHEASRKEERLMFKIQDEVFDSLRASL